MRLKSTFAGLLCLLMAPWAFAQEHFVRFQKGATPADAALQTGYASYRSEKHDVEVVLYGVVHIADAAYWTRVQADLDAFDAVLFEGVSPTAGAKPDENMKAIGALQTVMGDLLGLTFQKDGIDYTRKNLVHADMTQEQLLKAVDGDFSKLFPMGDLLQNEGFKNILPMLQAGAGLLKGMMERNPEMRNQLKMQFASQLSTQAAGGLGGELQRVLVEERNKVAMDVLKKQLAERKGGRVCIFYGAAHMPDFEKRLAELGYTRVSQDWVTAWKIGQGVGDSVPSPAPAPKGGRSEWF